MDQIKIGKFIAGMRKKQGLSQKQLAERIDVTDKTISKWETGTRLPDASILLKLSSELQINVNELLAGEKFLSEEFPSEEYVEKSENNIVNLISELNENEEKRKSRKIGTAIGVLCIVLAFSGLVVSSLPVGRLGDIYDGPTLFYLAGLKFLIISISNRFHDYVNAWKLCLPGTELSVKEMRASLQAIQYAGALSLTIGIFIASISIFSLLNYLNDTVSIGPALAQTVLSLFYTAIAETLYIILLFRIKHMIDERKQ